MFDFRKINRFVLIYAGMLNIFLFSAKNDDNEIIRAENLVVKRVIPVKSLADIEKENYGLLGKDYAVSNGNTLEIKTPDGHTKEIIQLVRPSFYGRDDKLSPSGDKVASLTMDKANKTTHIVINGVGQDSKIIKIDFMDKSELSGTWALSWSPDGNYLTYKGRKKESNDDDLSFFFLENLSTNQVIEISQPGSLPTWSADSKNLYYIKFGNPGIFKKHRSDVRDLYRYNLQTNENFRITAGASVTLSYPNNDGTKVIFTVKNAEIDAGFKFNSQIVTSSLILYNTLKNEFVELYTTDFSIINYSSVSWAPDGSKFVFCKNDEYYQGPQSSWERVVSKSEIVICNADGTGMKNITNTPDIIEHNTKWLTNEIIKYSIDSEGFIMELSNKENKNELFSKTQKIMVIK